MRSAFDDIVGNEKLRYRLFSDIAEQKMTHAYIIEGTRGSGKHMLGLRIAAALACEKRTDEHAALPCRTCASCHKILGGNSPDVIYIRRGDKASIGVEEIRGLRQDVYIAPNDTASKIYMIEDAHLMTVQAQNALLLTLEEPPPYVLFLLLCESAESLLETIRSRAPVLRTEPIPTDLIRAHITRINAEAARLSKNEPAEFSELLAAADGSIGQALELLEPKRRRPILASRAAAREFVALCAARRNSAAALRRLSGMGQKREELAEQLGTLLVCLRDLLLCKQSERVPLCFFSEREEACKLSYSFTTPELLNLIDSIDDALDRLRKNANVRLTLTNLAVRCGLL